MAAYASLITFAQKGIENIKERPSRLDAVKKIYKSMAAELKQFYSFLGKGNQRGISRRVGVDHQPH